MARGFLIEHQAVGIQAGAGALEGDLALPPEPRGMVIFAHGSGSGRFSPRNRQVADAFHEARFATLLLDLLTPAEQVVDERTRAYRFDVPLLGERTAAAVDWVRARDRLHRLPLGLFGASTGAAAALIAAARRPADIRAVVSRGGRPDLAEVALGSVQAPVLLVVGGEDLAVIGLNRQAAEKLPKTHRLVIVPGATHLFEEQGKLEEVARLAVEWFREHLGV